MGEVCSNGFTTLKLKFPPTGPHFRPRALRALGRNRGPLGGWSAIPYPPTSPMQKLHFFIVLDCIFPEIIIPVISDQLVRNFFADQSAK